MKFDIGSHIDFSMWSRDNCALINQEMLEFIIKYRYCCTVVNEYFFIKIEKPFNLECMSGACEIDSDGIIYCKNCNLNSTSSVIILDIDSEKLSVLFKLTFSDISYESYEERSRRLTVSFKKLVLNSLY